MIRCPHGKEQAESVNQAAALEVIQSAELMALRSAWIDAWRATVEPMQAVEVAEVVDPQTRVQQWFQANGLLFGLGLFCVLWGAWLGRKALHESFQPLPTKAMDHHRALWILVNSSMPLWLRLDLFRCR